MKSTPQIGMTWNQSIKEKVSCATRFLCWWHSHAGAGRRIYIWRAFSL